jgi:DNA-binding PadR family transcriptional regulator
MPTAGKSELLQGTLDLLILRTLETGPLHGYAIAQQINQTLARGPQRLSWERRLLVWT